MTFLPFILRRARRHWQILLTLSLGVILTTALLASGPLLVDTVVEIGLRRALQSADVADGNLRITTSAPINHTDLQTLDTELQALLQGSVGHHLDRVTRSISAKWMFPWVGGKLVAGQRVNLRFYEGIQDRVDYIAGEWPTEASDELNVFRAVISDGMARLFALRPGDRLPVSLRQQSSEPDAWIEVTGIIHPKDPRDPYWFGEYSPLASQATQRWSAQYSAIVPEDGLAQAIDTLYPGDKVDLVWHIQLRHRAFSINDIESFQLQIARLNAELGGFQSRITLRTGVPDILARFEQQLGSVRVPLYILIAEVMLLALFFVTMVAALSMRQVEHEFAVLRSRGASGWQIVRIQSVEALIVVTVAVLSGPVLASVLVQGLSWAGPLGDVGETEYAFNLSQSAWLAAGVGALACLAGLLLPVAPALRRSIVTHQQLIARDIRPPWWQRYYLDVFILVVGLVLLWRLRLYGEMVTGGPGGARLDWLLLLAPLALLLGAATILLRLFPLVLRALAFFAARVRGLAAPLALWQASRNPTHVARLVLLFTLAIALGILATGLNATLDQSEYDRAYYIAGNDLRMMSERAVPLVELQSAAGVDDLSGTWRGHGTVNLQSTETFPRFDLLAVEPESLVDVTTYRDDYAERDIGELLDHLAIEQGQHPSLLMLPGQPARLGLWVWAFPEDKALMNTYQRSIDGDSDAERVGVLAKLQTAQGELFTTRLQRPETIGPAALKTDRLDLQMNVDGRDIGLSVRIKPDNRGWHYFEGPVPFLPPSSYPLNLHSLWLENQTTRLGEPIGKSAFLVIDDLMVIDAETQEPLIVESFETPTRTLFLNTMDGSSIYAGIFTSLTDRVSRSGKWGQTASMMYSRPGQTYPLRLRQTWTREPLPALASPAFLEVTRLQVGDVARTWVDSIEFDFRIAGTVRYFPTMYEEREAGFLVTSRDLLLPLLNEASQNATNPNEVFIQTSGNASAGSLAPIVPLLSQSWEAESVRKTLKADPLALGLRSVTFFGYALTTVLALVGFATHFYMSVRQRATLYGVMRAMGLSSRQLYGSMALEQAVLIMAGLALGTGLGLLLNQITLARLPVSLGDRPPIPPFVPRADWLAVGQLFLVLAAAFLIVLAVITAILWRARIHRVLRIGQE